MNIDSGFSGQISYLDIESLANSQDVICIVDSDLKLRAYNDAWSDFAKNNNGGKILEAFSMGSKVTDAGADPINSYITKSYKIALIENKPFSQDYECSSPEEFRVFHQTAYPLVGSKGLVISHHLVVEKPHSQEEVEFTTKFINEHEIITQCANCRKIRDPKNEQIWVWVPSLVKSPLPNLSHGICIPCLDHYYPDIDEY